MLRFLAAVLIVAALVALVTGCASGGAAGMAETASHPTQTLSIKGALTYRARVALPPNSHAIVELKDTSLADGRVVAEQRIDLQGRQVPIPFEFAVNRAQLTDDKQYSVRGAIFVRARATWVSEPVLIAPKQQAIDLGVLMLTPFAAQAFTSTLQCGDQNATMGFVDNVMRLTVGDRSFDMRPVAAGSLGKYEAVSDPSTTFAEKGDRVMVTVAGRPYPECTRGGSMATNVRAGGNEPGWSLNIAGEEMTLVINHGQTSIVLPAPPAQTTAGGTKYVTQTGGKELTVTILDRLCADAMSGMPHPKSVVVLFDDKELTGCGGDPAALLQGAEWVVEDIDGRGLVPGSRATLSFEAEGRIHGKASCNTYTGKYVLTGEGLSISGVTATRMMCEGAVTEQESRFLDMLDHIRRFELESDGTLILHTDDRRAMKARRA